MLPYELESLKSGDKTAFKTFFTFYYPKLMALACRYVEKQVAKDIVQDVFVMFWDQKQTLNVTNYQSYLFKCTQNKCLNHIRHESVVLRHEENVLLAEARTAYLNSGNSSVDAWKNLMTKDIRQRIESSLNKLPSRCAEAFRLCYFHDLPHKKVAELMNISHRTVETHVRQAVSHLRTDLKSLSSIFLEMFEN